MLELAVDQPAEVEHLIVGEELDIARIRRRRHQRRVQVVEPVRAHRDAVARRGRRDAPPLGDAAAHGGVGLQDLGAALVEQFLESASGPTSISPVATGIGVSWASRA